MNSEAKIKLQIVSDFCIFLEISPNVSVQIVYRFENKSPRVVFYALSDSGSYSGGWMMTSEHFQKNRFFGHVTAKDWAGSPSPGNGQA